MGPTSSYVLGFRDLDRDSKVKTMHFRDILNVLLHRVPTRRSCMIWPVAVKESY